MFIMLELRLKGTKNYFVQRTYKIDSDEEMNLFKLELRKNKDNHDVRISYITI